MSARNLLLCTWALLGIHLLWMVVRFSLGFPIWGDEAFLVNNLSDASFADLIHPLPNGQIAPLLWLWMEKVCDSWGSGSIRLLRLPAFLAGVVSTWLMLRFCLRSLPQPSALFAFAIFTASYYPLRHAVEVKPYATDLLFALIQLNLALDLIRPEEMRRKGKAVALVLVSMVGVWASYPSLFVSASLAVYFLVRTRLRMLAVVASLVVAASSLWMVLSFALPHAQAASWLLEMDMWKPAFPPLTRFWELPLWFLERHCGYMSAYPSGGRDFGSSASFLLMLVGAVALWRSRQKAFLWLLVGPLVFNFLAAAGHFYPYGGSIRVSIFMAPALCLLMGHGVAVLVQRLGGSAQARVSTLVCALLFAFAGIGLVRDLRQPYKSTGDVRALEFADWLQQQVESGQPLLGWCNQHEGVPNFHGLGGSMARLRTQLRRKQVPVEWMDRAMQQDLPQAMSDHQVFWLAAYTDDNDTEQPFPEQELRSVLDALQQSGRSWEHFEFPFQHAERVDVYRFEDPQRMLLDR